MYRVTLGENIFSFLSLGISGKDGGGGGGGGGGIRRRRRFTVQDEYALSSVPSAISNDVSTIRFMLAE